MYLAPIADKWPSDPAYVLAGTGSSLTYGSLEARSNQVAHLLRSYGVTPGASLVLVLENRIEWPVLVAAGMRTGLYVTPLNWHLTSDELRHMLGESLNQDGPCAVITSSKCSRAVSEALAGLSLPRAPLVLSVDGPEHRLEDFHEAIATQPETPVDDELLGARVLYSGGTTGRPKPFRQQLPGTHPARAPQRHAGLAAKLDITQGARFLSPAPSYHAAPFTFQLMVMAAGGTVVCMERFDAEDALTAIEQHGVSHSQWVPTMLQRILRLPEQTRHGFDMRSHRVAVTSGAPCPPEVKAEIMEWWGEILHEYYGASEGYGHTYVSPTEALQRPGTVGRPLAGSVHIADGAGRELPAGEVGKVWFEPPADPYRAEQDGTDGGQWRSMGDLGRVDEGGYLYLVGRESEMIISGGVNVYPSEIENALAEHPNVVDVAVFGVPDHDLGEMVTAVVEPVGQSHPGLAEELADFCRPRLAGFKIPKRFELVDQLPRLPTGKLNKTALRNHLPTHTSPNSQR